MISVRPATLSGAPSRVQVSASLVKAETLATNEERRSSGLGHRLLHWATSDTLDPELRDCAAASRGSGRRCSDRGRWPRPAARQGGGRRGAEGVSGRSESPRAGYSRFADGPSGPVGKSRVDDPPGAREIAQRGPKQRRPAQCRRRQERDDYATSRKTPGQLHARRKARPMIEADAGDAALAEV